MSPSRRTIAAVAAIAAIAGSTVTGPYNVGAATSSSRPNTVLVTVPTVTVSVIEQVPQGQTHNSFTIPASDPAITYSYQTPNGQTAPPEGQESGSLLCNTSANTGSLPDVYSVTGCHGLTDPGYTIVYAPSGNPNATPVSESFSEYIVTPTGCSPITGTVTGGSSANGVVTLRFKPLIAPLTIGSRVRVSGLRPSGYDGTFRVIDSFDALAGGGAIPTVRYRDRVKMPLQDPKGHAGHVQPEPSCTPVDVTVNASNTFGSETNTDGWLSEADVQTVITPSSQTNFVTGDLACHTAASAVSPVGMYSLSACGGLFDPGHPVHYQASSSYAVVPAPLMVIAPTLTMPAGSPVPPLTPTYSGLQNGQSQPSTPADCQTPATPFSVPGVYAVTCNSAADPNYSITYQSGSIQVTPVSTTPPDSFGHSVAISADGLTALVGMPSHSVGGSADAGAAELYQRQPDGSWTQCLRLDLGANASAGDQFGFSVALNQTASAALVGAPGRKVLGDQAVEGAGEYFALNGCSVVGDPDELNLGANAGAGDKLGYAVALQTGSQGDVALVGAPYRKVGESVSGAAFVGSISDWQGNSTHELALAPGLFPPSHPSPPEGGGGDTLGWSVSLSSDGLTALVGAPGRSAGHGTNLGAAEVFATDSGGNLYWSAELSLYAGHSGVPVAADGDSLGFSASLNSAGTVALIGVPGRQAVYAGPGHTTVAVSSAGAGEIFLRLGSTAPSWVWSEELSLAAPRTPTGKDQPLPANGDELGWSASLSQDGRFALLGAPFKTVNPRGDLSAGIHSGTAELFTVSASNGANAGWAAELSLGQNASNGQVADQVGYAVAVRTEPTSGTLCQRTAPQTALLGAPNREIDYQAGEGSAEFYNVNPEFNPFACAFSMPPQEQTSGGPVHLSASMLSLGDSMTAGEGTLYGYTPASTIGKWRGTSHCGDGCGWTGQYPSCHESPYSYGQQVANDLNATSDTVRYVNFGCTGASFISGIAANESHSDASNPSVTNAQFGNWDSGTQLNTNYFDAAPNLILMDMGVNDIHFTKIIEACLQWDLVGNAAAAGAVVAALTLHPYAAIHLGLLAAFAFTRCTDSHPGSVFANDFNTQIPNGVLYSHLVSMGTWIRERADAGYQPRPKLVFTDYIQPINTGSWCRGDWVRTIGPRTTYTHAQRQHLAGADNQLDTAIAGAVSSLHASDPDVSPLVEVNGLFLGHQWCDSNPWDYALSTTSVWNEKIRHNADGTQGSQAPFHPTPCGQRQIANGFDGAVEPLFGQAVTSTACNPNLP